MYGYKNVKWVERIVVERPARAGLLGAARLRRRRVGRPLEWLLVTPRYVKRFSRTERAVHWIHASAFFVLLGTGLVLYVPRLSALVAPAPADQGHPHLHRGRLDRLARARSSWSETAAGCGERSASSICSIEDDRLWLGGTRGRRAVSTPGRRCTPLWSRRFASFSRSPGFLLWYGERDTRFRWASTILLHDGLMYVSLVLLGGSPLSGADLPRDPPRPARNHRRLGASRLGARAPPKVDRA